MLGAAVKTYFAEKIDVDPEDIYVVSVMPCTAKKDEKLREQLKVNGLEAVDNVITTRELGKMIEVKKIPYESLEEEEYDKPLGISTGAGAIFGATGGVMEAALRTAYELYTEEELPKLDFNEVRGIEGVKEATIEMKDAKLRVAVAHGGANIIRLMEKIKSGEAEYDFVEIMACPGGCIGGGGQPSSNDPDIIQKRIDAIYDIDRKLELRKSHENPAIKQIYEDFFGEPLSHLSHELLHTTYSGRKDSVVSRMKAVSKE
jgi:NADH-quinone oxidoreductase subunit G